MVSAFIWGCYNFLGPESDLWPPKQVTMRCLSGIIQLSCQTCRAHCSAVIQGIDPWSIHCVVLCQLCLCPACARYQKVMFNVFVLCRLHFTISPYQNEIRMITKKSVPCHACDHANGNGHTVVVFFQTHLGWRYIIYQPPTRGNQQEIMKTTTKHLPQNGYSKWMGHGRGDCAPLEYFYGFQVILTIKL